MWAVLSITVIDLVLSGDNAAVIGLAIRNLPHHQRRQAAIIGTVGAILLRVALTVVATVLLRIPYLHAIGGILLVWITWNLIAGAGEEGGVESSAYFWRAISTIVVADVSMAFDNVMGVAGAAQGNIPMMAFGLAISIPIVVAGSNFLAHLMNRHPIVIYAGGAVLAHTSLTMIFSDKGLDLPRHIGALAPVAAGWGVALVVLAYGWLRTRRTIADQTAAEVASDLEVLGDTLEEATVREEGWAAGTRDRARSRDGGR